MAKEVVMAPMIKQRLISGYEEIIWPIKHNGPRHIVVAMATYPAVAPAITLAHNPIIQAESASETHDAIAKASNTPHCS